MANYSKSVSFTRPSNTTAYDALDVIGAADANTPSNPGSAILAFTGFTLGNIAPNGSQIYITDVMLEVDVAAVPSGMGAFRVHFYNASPTAVLDGATFNLVAADRTKYLGYVNLTTPVDLGDTLWSENVGLNKKLLLAAGSSDLYAVIQTINGYTPTSAAVKSLTLHGIDTVTS